LGVRRASGWIDTSVSLDTLKGKKREEENCKQKRKKIRKKGGVDMCQRSDCMLCVSLYPVHRPPLFSCCFSILWPFSSSVRVHLATNRKGLAYPFFFKKEKKEKEIKVFSSSSFLPLPTHQST
jgi:hypothetical protein